MYKIAVKSTNNNKSKTINFDKCTISTMNDDAAKSVANKYVAILPSGTSLVSLTWTDYTEHVVEIG